MRYLFGFVCALALGVMSCGVPAEGEACAFARFEMTPEGGVTYLIENRQVCFKSKQQIECWIWNYRIPPKTDFSDYIDIFYDQSAGCETNDVDGGFDVPGTRYRMSGNSPGSPPEAPRNPRELMASGTYTTTGSEQGTFQLFW